LKEKCSINKCEYKSENEVKKKKRYHFRNALFFLVAGEPQISNFLEGYEMVVELWLYMNRQDA
jgi:hypothetical protein